MGGDLFFFCPANQPNDLSTKALGDVHEVGKGRSQAAGLNCPGGRGPGWPDSLPDLGAVAGGRRRSCAPAELDAPKPRELRSSGGARRGRGGAAWPGRVIRPEIELKEADVRRRSREVHESTPRGGPPRTCFSSPHVLMGDFALLQPLSGQSGPRLGAGRPRAACGEVHRLKSYPPRLSSARGKVH